MRAVTRPNMAPTVIPPKLTVKKASTANPYCPPGITGISQKVTIVLYRTIVTASVHIKMNSHCDTNTTFKRSRKNVLERFI